MTELRPSNRPYSIPETGSIPVSGPATNLVVGRSMAAEIVQDFLTVPGIAGIALIGVLMDGQPDPHLYAADPTLKIHRPKFFLTNLTQILRTLTPEVQQLDFFFGTYRIYVCHRESGFTVAVLTHSDVKWHNSFEQLGEFCQAVQSEPKAAIVLLENWTAARNHQRNPPPAEPHKTTAEPHPPRPESSLSDPSLPSLQDYLNAFNHLSTIASQYLGGAIVANQVKRSRPQGEILAMITIAAKGQLIRVETDRVLSPEELQALRQWNQDFRGHCSRIIRDFDATVRAAGLTSEESDLLTGVL